MGYAPGTAGLSKQLVSPDATEEQTDPGGTDDPSAVATVKVSMRLPDSHIEEVDDMTQVRSEGREGVREGDQCTAGRG